MNNTLSIENGTLFDLLTDVLNTTAKPTTTTEYRNRVPLNNVFVFTKVYTYMAYATGIPGNFLTIVILARMKPINSVQVWLLALSSMDFLTLTVRCCITPFISYGYIQYSDVQCWIEYIVTLSSEYCNYLFFLGMTSERFIAVWFPLKMISWTSPKKAAIGSLSILATIGLLQLHNIWTMAAFGSRGCHTKPSVAKFWDLVWVKKVETILFRTIPLVSVILLNILIVVRLGMNRGIKKSMSDGQAKEKQRQQNQINRLLTVATLFFFASVMPDIIYRLTWQYWGDPYTDWYLLRDIVITMNAVSALRTGNHAGNFFCYIVVARKFRNELIHLVTCGRYGEHNGVKGTRVKAAEAAK